MAKEILLYDYIYSYSVAQIIKQMEEAKQDDVVFRVNTPGGEVMYAYGIFAKYAELTKSKMVKVDGAADSCGAFLCCYAENVECLDVSIFTFHRASYDSYFESAPTLFTEAAKESLANVNQNLRAALEGKVREADFIKQTGVTYDELFSLETRIDVEVTAKQAKAMGLVQKINTITPEKKAEVNALVARIAAQRTFANITTDTTVAPTVQILKPNTTMTIQELKAAHPEAYAAAVNEGVTAERDRVGSFLAFIDVDAEAAVKGIKDGGSLTATATAEFSLKAINKQAGVKAEAENAPPVTTEEAPKPEAAKTEAEKKLAAFNAEVDKKLGLIK